MPTVLKPVAPFCDEKPVPLADQGFGSVHHPMTLLADEVLSPAGLDLDGAPMSIPKDLPCSRCSTPAPEFCLVSRTAKSHHHDSPYSKKVSFQRASSADQTCESPGEESSELSSDNESTISTLSEDSKIPKPPGEAGCPGRRGYTLETALKWDTKVYSKFKVHSDVFFVSKPSESAGGRNSPTALLKNIWTAQSVLLPKALH